jgi:hypothetical protein
MDYQTLFNVAVALAGFLGGWVLNNIKSSLDALHVADQSLSEKVQSIEILVASTYVKRDDVDKLANALFAKLDRIETKIDGKADK